MVIGSWFDRLIALAGPACHSAGSQTEEVAIVGAYGAGESGGGEELCWPMGLAQDRSGGGSGWSDLWRCTAMYGGV